MTGTSHDCNETRVAIGSAAVSEVPRDARTHATARNDDELLSLQNPDGPAVYACGRPAEGPLRHADTVTAEATGGVRPGEGDRADHG